MSPTLRAPGPRPGVEKIRRRYGAHPAHLLVLLASFLIAVLAFGQLLDDRPIAVATWFAGAAVLHDGLFVLAYIAADTVLVRLWRRRPGRVAWLNFVRVPLAISGIMLLVYSPVILGKASSFEGKTLRPTDGYLGHWLFVTAVLAALSAACYLTRLVVVSRTDRRVAAP